MQPKDPTQHTQVWQGVDDNWYFYDETGDDMGPYPSETRARKMLEAYCYWLDHGPTMWQSIWWPIKRFFTWR